MTASPSHIETARLLLRWWAPQDAPVLHESIQANLEHLRPWMPWVRHEPEPIERKVERLTQFNENCRRGTDLIYAIFKKRDDGTEGRLIGGTGLHPRVGDGAAATGYWIDAGETGRGYATEAAAAMVWLGFVVRRLGRIEIHCEAGNDPSARVAEKLGFTHQVTVEGHVASPGGDVTTDVLWRMLEAEYHTSPAARTLVASAPRACYRWPSRHPSSVGRAELS